MSSDLWWQFHCNCALKSPTLLMRAASFGGSSALHHYNKSGVLLSPCSQVLLIQPPQGVSLVPRLHPFSPP